MLYRYVNITDLKLIMNDLLYLKDDQIKDFIEQIFYAYRETYSDPKKILKTQNVVHSRNNAFMFEFHHILHASVYIDLPEIPYSWPPGIHNTLFMMICWVSG